MDKDGGGGGGGLAGWRRKVWEEVASGWDLQEERQEESSLLLTCVFLCSPLFLAVLYNSKTRVYANHLRLEEIQIKFEYLHIFALKYEANNQNRILLHPHN